MHRQFVRPVAAWLLPVVIAAVGAFPLTLHGQ